MAVAARYGTRVAHIEVIGTLFNDTQEVGSGSGLLVGDSYVLSNNHLIPKEADYKSLVIYVRLKTRLSQPVVVIKSIRDPVRDLVLLELSRPIQGAAGPRCPMPVLATPGQAPIGTHIYVMGFPLDMDLSLTEGVISNQSAGDGRWLTNSLINPGNSGGPAFKANGSLVGIAVGGVTKWHMGDEVITVAGANFLIPLDRLRESPLFDVVQAIPEGKRCWKDEGASSDVIVPSDFDPPNLLNKVATVSETKDDHPVLFAPHSQDYKQRFAADRGYRITGCSFHAESANHAAHEKCNVGTDGKAAEFQFELTSGPAIDQWRGWWAGTVTIAQSKIQ